MMSGVPPGYAGAGRIVRVHVARSHFDGKRPNNDAMPLCGRACLQSRHVGARSPGAFMDSSRFSVDALAGDSWCSPPWLSEVSAAQHISLPRGLPGRLHRSQVSPHTSRAACAIRGYRYYAACIRSAIAFTSSQIRKPFFRFRYWLIALLPNTSSTASILSAGSSRRRRPFRSFGSSLK